MFIIKLGGSVITDKAKDCTFKQKVMDNLSEQIKRAGKEAIIIHGAGSFGHIIAKKYDLNSGYKRLEQIKGFSETHEKVQALNSLVLKSLQSAGLPAVSISPHSTIKLQNHKLERMNYEIFEEYLEKKFMPVTFGDVVLDKTLGFSICSGDLLVQALAKHFKPEKVIFVMDEDGLYTANPKIDNKAKLLEKTTITDFEKLTTSLDSHADVTGGMAGKIENIKKITGLEIDTVLLNGNKADRLYHALVGEETKSTTVIGEKRK